jgi:hypothetical protein
MRNYIIVQTIVDNYECEFMSFLLITNMLPPAIGNVAILVAVGAIGLVSIPLTIDQIFSILNNNVNLCFQTWKYVPSNFGIWLMSIFV